MNNRTLLIAAALAVGLSGCSWLPSWMGGKKDEKPHLAGERVEALPAVTALAPDDTLNGVSFVLPPSVANSEWPQHSGNLASGATNIEAKGDFSSQNHARIGDGNSFDHILIPSPVIGGGLVFAMDATGNLSAHDMNNIGNVRWHSKGMQEEDEPEIIGGGLAYDQGKLYVTSGRGSVAAFDATNGKEIWRKVIGLPLQSAPRVASNRVFVTTIDNQLYALNAANGDVLWSQRGMSETAALMNSVTPVTDGDMVIAPYSSGELYALSQGEGREIWNDALGMSQHTQAGSVFAGIGGDPVIDSEVLFAVSSGSVVSALYAPNGRHIWESPVGSINTPWVSGDYVFVLTTDNMLTCFVKYDGRVRWSTKLRDFANQKEKKDPISWKGPVLVEGRLALVGSDGELLLVGAADGKVIATKEIPENIYTAPVVAGGRMYLIGQDATLYALQ